MERTPPLLAVAPTALLTLDSLRPQQSLNRRPRTSTFSSSSIPDSVSRGQILVPPSSSPQSSAPSDTISPSSSSTSALSAPSAPSTSPAALELFRSSTAARTLGWGLAISFQSLSGKLDNGASKNVQLEIEGQKRYNGETKARLKSEQSEEVNGYIIVPKEIGVKAVEDYVEDVISAKEICRFPEYDEQLAQELLRQGETMFEMPIRPRKVGEEGEQSTIEYRTQDKGKEGDR